MVERKMGMALQMFGFRCWIHRRGILISCRLWNVALTMHLLSRRQHLYSVMTSKPSRNPPILIVDTTGKWYFSLESREGLILRWQPRWIPFAVEDLLKRVYLWRGHNGGRGDLVFDSSRSGWLADSQSSQSPQRYHVVVEMECCWHKANRAWKTEGWASINNNNKGDTDDRLFTFSNQTLEDGRGTHHLSRRNDRQPLVRLLPTCMTERNVTNSV